MLKSGNLAKRLGSICIGYETVIMENAGLF